MDKNAKALKTLVNGLGITRKTLPANTKGTLLVPSDKAINAFVKQMGLSGKEFMSRKQLVDIMVSYHFIPGYQAKAIEDVPGNPTLAVTADFNYVLRFYKGNGRVWVKDVQGNDVTIKRQPIQFGQLSVVPIDRVLMSGGYFFNGLDALKQYPQWSEAFKLAQQAGWPVSGAEADITMFVPSNGDITAGARRAWAGLSKADQQKQLLYHFVRPAMSIPQQLQSGRLPTLLKGHDLKVDVTPAQ
ncbi:hypothetical protein COO60DRAFT_360168 [Scenedesmus sp. NREL 46B-D3]|nr:hypothetical protein COO60DRAFT_360168 [Scenedesmus sp. NREL 46B-D3]